MSRLKHKRGRKSNYVKSLNTDDWKEVRQRIIARDRSCRHLENGLFCESKLYLEVHHKTYYDKDGNSIVGKELENLDCLVLLCSEHHKKIHEK